MTENEQEILLHALKAIINDRRRHNHYVDGILDMAIKELGVKIECRREKGDRRNV